MRIAAGDDVRIMETFLKSIERRAYYLAFFACSNQDDALDLVQDAMCSFVAKYAEKPEAEWKALFYRTLQNKIKDFYRKEKVRSRWRSWLGQGPEGDDSDPLEQQADPSDMDPERQTVSNQAFVQLQHELRKLSVKQQQVFLLRAWEGLSVNETARIMGCSEGTVKTHYFRATEQLKKRLGDYWP